MLSQQERRFHGAFELLRRAIDVNSPERVTPGAALAVTLGGALVALKSFGRFTWEDSSPIVDEETRFDLASVTKVVATTSMAMVLFERGELSLDSLVCEHLPEFATGDPARRQVSVRMLLAHCSGLPAWSDLHARYASRHELLHAAATMPLESRPLAVARYSDIGFILLGEILERLAGESIAAFCQQEIFAPLGMRSACFTPAAELRKKIPPTMIDSGERNCVIQGVVNDENASRMGGVAGHAGLFSNAADLAVFCDCMLNEGRSGRNLQLFKPETVELFTTAQPLPLGTSRALGWDTPSAPSQSGSLLKPGSFGHLGHTGCSLWCDPARKLSVVLLTNRTWPDRANERIKKLRPILHNAIVQAADASPVA